MLSVIVLDLVKSVVCFLVCDIVSLMESDVGGSINVVVMMFVVIILLVMVFIFVRDGCVVCGGVLVFLVVGLLGLLDVVLWILLVVLWLCL